MSHAMVYLLSCGLSFPNSCVLDTSHLVSSAVVCFLRGLGFLVSCTSGTFDLVLPAMIDFLLRMSGFPDSRILGTFRIEPLTMIDFYNAGQVFLTHAHRAHFVLCLQP